jgi:type I restriction enzyme S subunit
MSEVAQAIHSSPDGHIPQLRFPEFSGEWMTDELSNLIEISSNKFNPNTSNESKKCIELEHLSQETGELLGYTDSTAQASTKNAFTKGQVLFGKLRPYLKKFWLSQFDGVCSSEIWVLNGKKLANNYLFQFIQTNKFNQIANVSSGSKMPRSDWKYMVQVPFKYTTKPEQQKIAAFLTAVDNKIEQLSKKQELLSEYKKGVMQQIFSQAIRFKADDGSEFPEWKERRLGDVCSKAKSGGTPRSTTKEYYDGDIPFLAISDITRQGKYLTSASKKISQLGIDNSASWIVPIDTIIYSMYASVGFVSINKIPLATSQAVINLIVKDGYSIEFIYYHLIEVKKTIHKFIETGTQGNLNAQTVKSLILNIPSLPEQAKIANFLSSIDNKIEQVGKQLDESKQFKKALLQQMFV